MDQPRESGFGEFLQDIRGVIVSPRRRFPMILEREAIWGSLFLMFVPGYFAFAFLGGVYFDKDPFPGYSLLVPAAAAGLLVFLKTYVIHIIARLLEGKGRYFSATGKFRNQVIVIGYAGLPELMASIIALTVFLILPGEIGYMIRHFRVVTMSVLIALGIAFFLWNLILVVLSLRNVYPMHDMKIVVAVILGSVVLGFSLRSITNMFVRPSDVNIAYVLPVINERMGRLFAVDPSTEEQKPSRMDFHVDQLAYRGKLPRRFDLIFFSPIQSPADLSASQKGGVIVGKVGVSSDHSPNLALVRIIGLPGETVELKQGQLLINQVVWVEPYITSEWRSPVSIPARTLGSNDYFALPENRHLLESGFSDLVIARDRIAGRMVTNKLPLGWWFLQAPIFEKGHPETGIKTQ